MARHPYYPPEVLLSGHQFAENELSSTTLIAVFATGCAAILSVAALWVRRATPELSRADLTLTLWFMISGTIHMFFESFFVYNNSHIASMQSFFAQLWKEYALSDSRYMFSDPLVLCMESWTVVVWGPLCLLTATFIATNSPYRHPVQALVSTGHLYGNLLYLSTSLYEAFHGQRYYRPESYYFWVYFVLMNSPWLIVPAWCLYKSIRESAEAFASVPKQKLRKDSKGSRKSL